LIKGGILQPLFVYFREPQNTVVHCGFRKKHLQPVFKNSCILPERHRQQKGEGFSDIFCMAVSESPWLRALSRKMF